MSHVRERIPRSGWLVYAAAAALMAVLLSAGAATAFDPKKVERGVYKINVLMQTKDGKVPSSGTGFLVSGQRIVATNHHVVEDGVRYIIAFLDGRNPRLVEARLVDTRPHLDLALLEAYEDLPGEPFPLAEYKPDKLSDVVAIGFPGKANVKSRQPISTEQEWIQSQRDLAMLDASHTPGKVSRVTIAAGARLSETQVVNALTVQHNAPINPGNSGGPLLDSCGEVVGVNSFNPVDSQGIFFSIHASEVARILSDNRLPYTSASATCSGDAGPWGGLMPVVVGMTAMFAAAALFITLRRGALPQVSQSLNRLTQWRRMPGTIMGGYGSGTRQYQAHGSAPSSLVLRSRASGSSWPIDRSGRTATVGRHPSREVVISDETVSATHARLAFDPASNRFQVTDLGSSNGTFVNGKRVTSAHFGPGDTLRFGTAELEVAAGPSSSGNGASHPGWLLSGFDASGRAVQIELKPPADGSGATWTIGRDPSRARQVIDDSSLSGLHAQIAFVPGQGLVLRDLGSTNGTQIDGSPAGTREVQLSSGTHEITFGGVRLRLSTLIS